MPPKENEVVQIVFKILKEQNIYCCQQNYFFLSRPENPKIHSWDNVNIGDLFEAWLNLEGLISIADQCPFPRRTKGLGGDLMY